jgi:antitoxin component YwqK of YwqJK toxin-antitoxin module
MITNTQVLSYYDMMASKVLNGYYECYVADRLTSKGRYINDYKEGYWECYHLNGNLWYKGYYKDDLSDGYWEYYHENGVLLSRGKYKDDENIDYWEYYTEDGVLNYQKINI